MKKSTTSNHKNRNKILCIVPCLYLSLFVFSQEMRSFITYCDGAGKKGITQRLLSSGLITDSFGKYWKLQVDTIGHKGVVGAAEFNLTWTALSDSIEQVSTGVSFSFKNWATSNYVFVPSAVYNGNKFHVKDVGWPRYWYDKKEWKIDMPTTTSVIPSLNNGVIELNTGNAATPLMAFFSLKDCRGWIVQTTQGNQYGNYGLTIQENIEKKEALFSISSPSVREKRATGRGLAQSDDRWANLKKGDTIKINLRTYQFKANSLNDFYAYFMNIRKECNPNKIDNSLMPFSEIWKMVNKLYQEERWDGNTEMFNLSKPGSTKNWHHIWRLGWVGGGQVTYPLILNGDSIGIYRAIKNLDIIFRKTQAASGFYNVCGDGKKFVSFGFAKPFTNNETLVRSQGDFLYLAQLQFRRLQELGMTIENLWINSLKRQADAFVSIYNKYGQIGQFVDVKTGDICIGGSTSGAIVPAGLVLASETYKNKNYLNIACLLAEKYYQEFVLSGYTTGGPGEILSTPDSESAFALFESFIVLYEQTKQQQWLKYASDLLPICASWVVSYNYEFPKESIMGKLNIQTTGSVWANLANKHSAPAICTWSGDALLRYFRATEDWRAIDLLKDIVHGVPQYVSHSDRKIGKLKPGEACERVNMSDWEGEKSVGGNIFASCSWVETAVLLTVSQLPSIYVQPDIGQMIVFDQLNVKQLDRTKEGRMAISITNSTDYDADVKLFMETSIEARSTYFSITDTRKIKTIHIPSRKTVRVII